MGVSVISFTKKKLVTDSTIIEVCYIVLLRMIKR